MYQDLQAGLVQHSSCNFTQHLQPDIWHKLIFSTLLLADIHVEVFLLAQPISPSISEGQIQFPLQEFKQKKGLALQSS